MSRVVVGLGVTIGLIVLGLSGCEKGRTVSDKPYLVLDRDSLADGGVDFGAVYIGTKPQETLMLENKGIATMTISDVTKSGDGAFTIMGPTSKEVKGLERSYVQIVFAPTAERAYSGSLTITSDADNTPTRVVSLYGKGVKPPPEDAGM